MVRRLNGSRQTQSLLALMARQPRAWQYGYELSKETGLRSGTLYPLLIRLSDQGLLESKWLEPERLSMYRSTLGGGSGSRRYTRADVIAS